MSNDTGLNLKNGLYACVDWLAFTITDPWSVHQVMNFLGFDESQFTKASRGASGYKSMYNLDGHAVSVLYDGAEGMGIHVNIAGSAVAYCVEAYKQKITSGNAFNDEPTMQVDDLSLTALSQFLRDIRSIGKLSRLDLAIDDRGKDQFFTCQQIEDYLHADQVITKFRSYQVVKDHKHGQGIKGHTIYLGARRSDTFLRIYDKMLEQKSKNPEASDDPWVRWELELKGNRANQAADFLAAGLSMGDLVLGILKNYFRIVIKDDSNLTRCTVIPEWQAFCDGVQSIRLYVPDRPKTLEDKKQWIDKQVLSTLAGLFLAYGGTFCFIEDNLELGIRKMKYNLRELVLKANPDARQFLDLY